MAQEDSLRERLIGVGVDVVMTDGIAALGLREIARRAGVSHGAPRRYFATHHALLSAIAQRGFADLRARFEAATAAVTSPRDRLAALAHTYVRYALEHRGMFELMFRHDLLDSGPHTSAHGPRLRESTLPLFETIVALIAECRTEPAGRRRDDVRSSAEPPPAVTAAALWSNLHGIAQLWAWDSLRLALGTPSAGPAPGGDHLELLVTAALDAHLGPARA
ncbi:TetR/AcrR family transcriptional regulator [Embleya scabrispora]|uniref:TetR/AcrR family transcriptional regulator n=1 Tax=Embleya scabrispora TaxID=159449 RepID=UPI0003A1A754|nr:TetR/AcrR family transcriptional regulator [Embleya scabrispora]MYS86140.1 TetR family transcriptional regulator [Streptomyces sp. SID5474]